jgi:hypothetical protein
MTPTIRSLAAAILLTGLAAPAPQQGARAVERELKGSRAKNRPGGLATPGSALYKTGRSFASERPSNVFP